MGRPADGLRKPGGALTLLLVFAFVLVVAPVGPGSSPAYGSCVAPTLERVDGPVGRGRVVELLGSAWGDDCHDTGVPPGEGPLGEPLQDVEVTFEQEGRTWPLATVDADADYEIRAEVVVPLDAVPGRATITVGDGDPSEAQIEVTVSGDEPLDPPETTVAAGQIPEDLDDPDVHDHDRAEESDRSVGTWAVLVGAVVVVAAVGWIAVRAIRWAGRRDGTIPPPRPR